MEENSKDSKSRTIIFCTIFPRDELISAIFCILACDLAYVDYPIRNISHNPVVWLVFCDIAEHRNDLKIGHS